MTQYYHKKLGRVVELVPGQQFSSHWNFYDKHEGVQVIRHGLPGVDLVPVAEAEQKIVGLEETLEVTSIPKAPTVGFVKLLNLNTETSSSVIALHLPGIGRVAAKKICDRRPKIGYKDFFHFKQINSDLNMDEEVWEKVKGLVEF